MGGVVSFNLVYVCAQYSFLYVIYEESVSSKLVKKVEKKFHHVINLKNSFLTKTTLNFQRQKTISEEKEDLFSAAN